MTRQPAISTHVARALLETEVDERIQLVRRQQRDEGHHGHPDSHSADFERRFEEVLFAAEFVEQVDNEQGHAEEHEESERDAILRYPNQRTDPAQEAEGFADARRAEEHPGDTNDMKNDDS